MSRVRPSGRRRETPAFRVFVDDNYAFTDSSARRPAGTFATWEEAVAACRRIVDASLAELAEPDLSAAELLGKYRMFGEDPFVVGEPVPEPFSAWGYAERRCAELCGGEPGR